MHAVGRERGRRSQHHSDRGGRQGLHANDGGREELRCGPQVSPGPAPGRGIDQVHSRRDCQQHRDSRGRRGAGADAQKKILPLVPAPYRVEWSGEFQEMEAAEYRMLIAVAISFALIFLLLYLAFRSLLDTLVIFANVATMSMGGVWALLLTG